jgi:hypothetical protein
MAEDRSAVVPPSLRWSAAAAALWLVWNFVVVVIGWALFSLAISYSGGGGQMAFNSLVLGGFLYTVVSAVSSFVVSHGVRRKRLPIALACAFGVAALAAPLLASVAYAAALTRDSTVAPALGLAVLATPVLVWIAYAFVPRRREPDGPEGYFWRHVEPFGADFFPIYFFSALAGMIVVPALARSGALGGPETASLVVQLAFLVLVLLAVFRSLGFRNSSGCWPWNPVGLRLLDRQIILVRANGREEPLLTIDSVESIGSGKAASVRIAGVSPKGKRVTLQTIKSGTPGLPPNVLLRDKDEKARFEAAAMEMAGVPAQSGIAPAPAPATVGDGGGSS